MVLTKLPHSHPTMHLFLLVPVSHTLSFVTPHACISVALSPLYDVSELVQRLLFTKCYTRHTPLFCNLSLPIFLFLNETFWYVIFVNVWMWGQSWHQVSSIDRHCFQTGFLTKPRANLFSQNGWPASPRDLPTFGSPVFGLQPPAQRAVFRSFCLYVLYG